MMVIKAMMMVVVIMVMVMVPEIFEPGGDHGEVEAVASHSPEIMDIWLW